METVNFSPNVSKRLKEEQEVFIAENNKDTHYDFEFFVDIPGSEGHTLVYEEKLGGKPWYADNKIRCLLDVVILGWI